MQITIFIYSYWLSRAYTYQCLWFVFKVDFYTSIFQFDINEKYMMLRNHRMRDTSNFNLQHTVIYLCDDRNMFLITCIHGIGN